MAGARFVQRDAQRVNVRRRCAGAFGRNVTFGADKRPAFAARRNQSDVGELRAAIYVNDVPRFHITVDQSVAVELRQAADHVERQAEAIGGGEAVRAFEVGTERAGEFVAAEREEALISFRDRLKNRASSRRLLRHGSANSIT